MNKCQRDSDGERALPVQGDCTIQLLGFVSLFLSDVTNFSNLPAYLEYPEIQRQIMDEQE